MPKAHHPIQASFFTPSSPSETSGDTQGKKSVSPPPAWVTKLAEDVAALGERRLSSLNFPETLLLARQFAVVFGYCRTKERTNMARARSVLTSLSELRTYLRRSELDITIRTFFAHAAAYHKAIGEPPWFTPYGMRAIFDEYRES